MELNGRGTLVVGPPTLSTPIAEAAGAAETTGSTLVASGEAWRVGLAAAAADVEAAWLRLTGKIETLRYGQRSPSKSNGSALAAAARYVEYWL